MGAQEDIQRKLAEEAATHVASSACEEYGCLAEVVTPSAPSVEDALPAAVPAYDTVEDDDESMAYEAMLATKAAKHKQKLKQEIEAHKRELSKLTEQTAQALQEAENKITAVKEAELGAQSKVVVNIGGTRFETTRVTLTAVPGSHIADIFCGMGLPTVEGAVFIDRDPTHFRHILNYLRYKSSKDRVGFAQPTSVDVQRELAQEAKFYGLGDLYSETCGPDRHSPVLTLNGLRKDYVAGCRNFAGFNLSGMNVSGMRFDDCDFSNISLFSGSFERCKFVNCEFSGAELNVSFKNAVFEKCNFKGAKVMNYSGAKMINCDFKGVHFGTQTWSEMQYDTCDFRNTTISDVTIEDSKFFKCKFRNAKMERLHFRNCTGIAYLQGCLLCDTEFYGGNWYIDAARATIERSRFVSFTATNLNFESATIKETLFEEIVVDLLPIKTLRNGNYTTDFSNSTLEEVLFKNFTARMLNCFGVRLCGKGVTLEKFSVIDIYTTYDNKTVGKDSSHDFTQHATKDKKIYHIGKNTPDAENGRDLFGTIKNSR